MVFDHIEEKEAVEKAALIEKNGIAFYSLVLEKIDDKKIKSSLKKLIGDEKKHLKKIEKKYFPEAGFDEELVTEEELEIEEYVKKLGVPDIFARRINIERLVKAIDEPKKALLIALDSELHAANYFEDLSKKARTAEGRKIYGELAAEEKEHANHIEELLKAFK